MGLVTILCYSLVVRILSYTKSIQARKKQSFLCVTFPIVFHWFQHISTVICYFEHVQSTHLYIPSSIYIPFISPFYFLVFKYFVWLYRCEQWTLPSWQCQFLRTHLLLVLCVSDAGAVIYDKQIDNKEGKAKQNFEISDSY